MKKPKYRIIESDGKYKVQQLGWWGGYNTMGYTNPDLEGLDAKFDSVEEAENAIKKLIRIPLEDKIIKYIDVPSRESETNEK